MKKQFLILFAAIFALFEFYSPATAQKNPVLAEAAAYSKAISKFEKQTGKQSVETVFRQGQNAAEKLVEVMESLNETDYALAQKLMKGYSLNRFELIYAEPDAKFFKRLAARGTPADIAFFALQRELKPNDVTWAFIEMQTDVSGCTLYGKGGLTVLYGKVKRFKAQYPKTYTSEIEEAASEIKRQLTEGTCACADENSVTKEFQLFIKTFPKDEATPAVKKRLTEIKKSEMRFKCQSG